MENTFLENFNGRLRDECLNAHVSVSTVEAERVLDAWRYDYNHVRLAKLEAPPGFEPGVEVLQTSALPLGDGALLGG
jgi:hypothetical protein